MWNDIPADELRELMDEIDAVELRPDEADLERWIELSRGLLDLVQVSTQNESEQKERERLSACLDFDFIARGETVEDVLEQNLGPCRAMS
jgi:hypothetical protein